jgi:hypothetical protein
MQKLHRNRGLYLRIRILVQAECWASKCAGCVLGWPSIACACDATRTSQTGGNLTTSVRVGKPSYRDQSGADQHFRQTRQKRPAARSVPQLEHARFVAREEFSRLSSVDRTILSAEGIESPFDLTVYDLTERIIFRVHEESEKICLLFDREPQSATERYPQLFTKYLSQYLLWPHLMGGLAFADARDCSQLQAAKLLAEAVCEWDTQKRFYRAQRVFLCYPAEPAEND